MATATERATLGAEEARLEGKGFAGRATNAAKATNAAATGQVDNHGAAPFNSGVHQHNTDLGPDGTHVGDRDHLDHHHHHDNGGMLGKTEEEMAKLRNRTLVTHEGEAYCPNPNIRDLVSPTA